ncbi:MAG: DUF1573 domain-containing protein [Arachidicoccus sp.]|nr:DUF1573 domain-containing protein [Arachidicoccus sp.]
MKYLLVIFMILGTALNACKNNTPDRHLRQEHEHVEKDTSNFTRIQWLDSMKNFGTAKYGDKVNIEYTFKNIGDKPLYLLSVQPTCGCTIADYTKSAVMPGNQGYVKAIYDSHHGVPGSVRKSIIVTSNTKNDANFVLAFTGKVVK